MQVDDQTMKCNLANELAWWTRAQMYDESRGHFKLLHCLES